ncbi:MAG: shikimate dehydrogenase [Armatimonadetes bacterium RBG_16_58_9]|nr:MAG: shikimate dehydrogenase [Armatimonadetes bacterium RBG_16_58_9]
MLGNTKILGVFGHPVSHSLSPVIHNAAISSLNIDYIYVPFHVLPENLDAAVAGVRALEIVGVNVTIPHKEKVIGLLDDIGEDARGIGSVNTVINRDGRLRGESTDGAGFLRSAEAEWGKLDGCKVVILGAGGSAKAVAFSLAQVGCEITIANRTYERAVDLSSSLSAVFEGSSCKAIGMELEGLVREVGKADLLVNTTSVGMRPDVDSIPLPADLLRPGLLVYDLVYSPVVTRLAAEAESRGARAVTGLKMLVYQGALSFEMWTGIRPPVSVMEDALTGHIQGECIKT